MGAGFTYTPKAGFTGTDYLTYVVTDAAGQVDDGTVQIQVVAAGSTNAAPVTRRDVVTTLKAAAWDVSPLGNDFDPDGDSFTLVSVNTPANGTVSFGSTSFTYTPSALFTGVETLTYTVKDAYGVIATGTGTVTIAVRGGTNKPPVATSFNVGVNGGASVALTLTGTALNLTYTAPLTSGWQYLSYRTNDGSLNSGLAVVGILVNPNRVPLAAADGYTVLGDTTALLPVLGNDTDPDGDPLTITAVTVAAVHGTVSCSAEACTYTPFPGYNGADQFTYRVSVGRGGLATAVVTVGMVSLNDTPVAQFTAAPVNGGTVTLVATDGDSPTLSFQIGAAANGTITAPTAPVCIVFSGLTTCTTPVVYARNGGYTGPDTFGFTAYGGTQTSNVALVTVPDNTVLNNPPVPSLTRPDPTGTTPFATTVLIGATDADAGETLTYSVDWGDGTAASTGTLLAGPLAHTYLQAGTFNVRLEVSDGQDTAAATGTIRAGLSEPL